jgi:N-acetylglucosaminyl-diphospho-decaprenol L-rhamnosyltransferase
VLSVAIINYETPELTASCVGAIRRWPPGEPFEVLVVDNGSSGATLAVLRRIDGARVVETGRNGGFATGVNRCVAEADPTADVVVVLNSDTEVEPGALDALAEAARRPGVGLAAPVVLHPDRTVQRSAHRRFPTLWSTWMSLCVPLVFAQALLERFLPHPSSLSVAEHEAGTRPLHVMGAAMAIGREAWEQVGRFDERFFMYLEETEWQRRLHAAGWRVELVPQARVLHLHRGGDDAVGVPPLTYLDSTRRYFGALGRSDLAIRGALASSLLVSWLALLLYAPFSRWSSRHRHIVAASRPLAWRGVVHLVRGRTVPRPDAA